MKIGTAGNLMRVFWPSNSAGWSLQSAANSPDSNWGPGRHEGWVIDDDGTNKSLTMPRTTPRKFFRLVHP
jgi:hypothetical protein